MAKSIVLTLLTLVFVVVSGCDDTDKPAEESESTKSEAQEVIKVAAEKSDSAKTEPSVYDFTMNNIDGEAIPLADYRGKVLMIVNVASKCGATPQYEQLQKIFEKYSDSGFIVLGFPANNFGKQEPGTNAQIKEFCTTKYSVTFPMFEKISVKGDDIHPLYKYLTEEKTNPDFAGEITWNFNKFLIAKDGMVINRFATKVKPDAPEVIEAIESALK